jgi:hypothetical protein
MDNPNFINNLAQEREMPGNFVYTNAAIYLFGLTILFAITMGLYSPLPGLLKLMMVALVSISYIISAYSINCMYIGNCLRFGALMFIGQVLTIVLSIAATTKIMTV